MKLSDEDFEMVDRAYTQFEAGLLPDLRTMEKDLQAMRQRGRHEFSVGQARGEWARREEADNAPAVSGTKGLASEYPGEAP